MSKGLHDLSKAVKINPVSFVGNYHMPTLEIVTKMEFKARGYQLEKKLSEDRGNRTRNNLVVYDHP